MEAAQQIFTEPEAPGATVAPVVIVGAGPVGVRALEELRRLHPEASVVLYGDETHQPYNRVQLSGLLAGQVRFPDIALAAGLLERNDDRTRFMRRRVARIVPELHLIIDAAGVEQHYSKLILATGSRPFVPAIPGMDLPGVYTFRNMADAERLAARRTRSQHTVVLGGGLLGIEAARAMQRFNTRVSLVEHNAYPMFRQLDPAAGAMLAEALTDRKIDLRLSSSVRMVLGTSKLEGLVLRDGSEIPCDTLVVATGIRPNVDLAAEAGLAFGRGIQVDGFMRSSEPDIYAVGECCEFEGEVFGLVAPGLEQAAIAARHIGSSEGEEAYRGTPLATSLKVADMPVFSLGETNPDAGMQSVTWRDGDSYRRVVLSRGRIRGLLSVGDWAELPVLRDWAATQRFVFPWQLWRFRISGDLLHGDSGASVLDWPDAAIVCNCNAVSAGRVRELVHQGCDTTAAVTARCDAGGNCGSCQPLLQELVGGAGPRQAARAWKPLGVVSLLSLVLVLAGYLLSVQYPQTVQLSWRWDELWRDSWFKQVSGFTLLGLSAVGLLMLSARKRVQRFRAGEFGFWRLGHVVFGVCALLALGVHTGFRLGDHLNFALMACFLGLALAGTLMGLLVAAEHRLQPARARRWRSVGQWSHVLLTWPLPILLGFHILKTYYF